MLRDNNVEYHVIAEILDGLKGGRVMSKSSVIAVCARGSDAHEGRSGEMLCAVKAFSAIGGDETQGRLGYTRLTAEVAEMTWIAEYIRGALLAMAGGCARAALSPVLPEEPALPEAATAAEDDERGRRRPAALAPPVPAGHPACRRTARPRAS